MWKKIAAAFLVLTVLFNTAAPFMDDADARRYRSPVRTFTPDAPKQTAPKTDARADSGAVNRADTANSGTLNRTGTPASTAPAAAGRPLPGLGGGFLQGLMLGGLAGLLFGSLLAEMGGFGALFGLLLNVFAIYLLIVLLRNVAQLFRNRVRPKDDRPGGDVR